MRLESMISRVGTGMVMNMLRGAEMRFHEFLQKAAPGKGFGSGQCLSGLLRRAQLLSWTTIIA